MTTNERIETALRYARLVIDTPSADLSDDDHAAATETFVDFPLSDLDMLDHNARELITSACLALSICPLHMIDYAICFDDDDDECRAIRTIHPSHDT